MLIANYGSNLSTDQFKRRCPSAVLVGTGTIRGFRLTFTGRSSGWGGAVATIKPAKGKRVPVAVYELRSPEDVRTLDRCEGFPRVYGCEEVTVHLERPGKRAKRIKAWTYVKRDQREGQPSNEYLKRVAQGYKDHGLDTQALAAALCALPAGTAMPKGKPKRKGKRKGKAKRKKAAPAPAPAPVDQRALFAAETCGGSGCTPDLRDASVDCPWCDCTAGDDHCPECCPEALIAFGAKPSTIGLEW